ncbi:MAG: right-handed parallel beta-helix repeat-containing protein [Nanoarchaeota archaeon]|nr:right-handed parallel beta-helix repeat-containing protein [Nanoarchaeota archaeon]
MTYGGNDSDYKAIANYDGYDNITIKNCIISQNGTMPAQHAIVFEGSENAVIFNNTITTFGGLNSINNGSFGIKLDMNSTNANITSNIINTSGAYSIGIFLGDSGNSTINNNIIITSGNYAKGLFIDDSLNNSMASNQITTSGENAAGIHNLMDCSFSVIYNNTIITSGNNNSHGIYLDEYSQNMNVTSNTITTFGGTGYGIKAESMNDTFMSNTIITSGNESLGIYLRHSNLTNARSNTITTTGQVADGIYINFGAGINLTNNIINTTKGLAIWVAGAVAQDYNHTINNNTEQGDRIYYLFNNNSGIIENVNAGQIFAASSNNLTFDNLTLNKDGITFILTSNSTIKNSNITLSGAGISHDDFRTAYYAIGFSGSHYNNITNNTISAFGAAVDGIYMEQANHSIFTKNRIHVEGLVAFVIYIYSSACVNNTFYNNFFNASIINSLSQTGVGYEESVPTLTWNTTKTAGTNIIGKSYIGGNYWGNNNGTGYSDTCLDADGDYICDAAVSIMDNNIDYLPLAAYTTQIDECRDITLPNTAHRLNQSLSAAGTCIQIKANSIILDFNGYNITGNLTGYGVNISSYNGTTIKNGFVYNFSKGIFLENSGNNNITNMTANNNGANGVYLLNSSDNDLSDITANNNGVDGIRFNSSNNRLTRATANSNGDDGIKTKLGEANNTLMHITANNNVGSGIYSANNSRLMNITANNNNVGISIATSNNVLTNLTANNNSHSGIWLGYTSANNTLTDFNINNSRGDAIHLTGATSSNRLTNMVVRNTNSSYYDLKFNTAGINGTWIIDSNFANYTFTGAGGLVNFKDTSYGIISFLEPINGSGTNLSGDIKIRSNSIVVASSNNPGLNRSANITLYSITHTDPKPQYSSDGITFTDCTSTSNPSCSELSFSGNTFVFNTSHFTYFRAAEAYSAPGSTPSSDSSGGGGGVASFWLATYTITEEQFKKGYTKELIAKSRINLKIGDIDHYIGVIELTNTTAKINVSSAPQQAILSIGDKQSFDVTEDGYFDFVVALNGIADNKANITIIAISEQVSEKTEEEELAEEKAEAGEEEGLAPWEEPTAEPPAKKSLAWLYALLALVAIGLVIAIAVKKKKKNR